VRVPPWKSLSGQRLSGGLRADSPAALAGRSIILQVTRSSGWPIESERGTLFLPSRIKEMAPSLAEGRVLNFNDVNRDIIALNQLSDQRVTPSLRPGVTPGTVDINLDVKEYISPTREPRAQ